MEFCASTIRTSKARDMGSAPKSFLGVARISFSKKLTTTTRAIIRPEEMSELGL